MADSASKIPFDEGAAPSPPSAGQVVIYAKTDGLLYSKDDAGSETLVSGGAGGGSVATDTIWDAAGDLVQGTGANTAAKLTVGAAGTTLKSTGSAAAWVACPNMWTMSLTSSQTLTNNTLTTITWDRADIDGGGSVIDLANNRFVAPATGFYMAYMTWMWETTAPVIVTFMDVLVGGAGHAALVRVPGPTTATAVFAGTGGMSGTWPLTLTSGDFVTAAINPGAVTGVTARGNASRNLATAITLVRIT